MNLNRFTGVILAILTLVITSCKGLKMEEKFKWTGTVSAPQEYPAEVYEGAIVATDFTYSFDAIWGTQNTGWGNVGGIMSVEREQMEAPDSLNFTWFSIVEKKFYTGAWKLDKAKIAKLFREGFIDDVTKKKDTYNLIKVGLAPKGKVVVWLSGAGFQTEVGSFEARDTTITKDMAYDNAKYMFNEGYVERTLTNDMIMKPEIKARIVAKGYPNPGIYDQYRIRYSWRPKLELPEGGKPLLVYYSFLNGEEENRFGEDLAKNEYSSRACPKIISLVWQDANGKKNGLAVEPFDEQEVMEAFHNLSPASPIDLIIKLSADHKSVTVSVANQSKEIPLYKGNIEISNNLN